MEKLIPPPTVGDDFASCCASLFRPSGLSTRSSTQTPGLVLGRAADVVAVESGIM